LITAVLLAGKGVNWYWLWLPFVWGCEIVFVCGLALMFSSLNVYVRDMRYVVESANTVLFWLVPIFYSFQMVPARYHAVYLMNPIACVVLAEREVLMGGTAPSMGFVTALALVSGTCLALGFVIFGRLKQNVADYL